MNLNLSARCCALVAIAGSSQGLWAQTIDPFYAGAYSYVDLGAPPGVPGLLGGINFLPGNPNVMLVGGGANGGTAAIYRVDIVRDAGHNITGFTGAAATLVSTAPNIDGGLTIGPASVLLYTAYPIHTLGQIKPGSVVPDKLISLSTLGILGSVGACAYVPGFSPGAGLLKIAAYGGGYWYSAELTPDGLGTYDLAAITAGPVLPGGPEGIAYIPRSSPLFGTQSLLITEYGGASVSAYEVDSHGDPVLATRRPFMTGLGGAEGAVLDPVTSQFLFSTFSGQNRVIVVRGFVPPPPCYANCDNSSTPPVLNTGDFSCFLNAFAAGDSYANCDQSTIPPVLNVLDFACFINKFGAGCS